MKKLFFSVAFFLPAMISMAQCNELFISEYVEGTYNNKALELFNPTNSDIDLGNYRIIRWDNGNTIPAANEYMTLPVVSIPAHDVYVIVINTTDVGTDTLPFAALAAKADTQLTTTCDPTISTLRTMCFNGDDALSLEKNVGGTWTKVDIFGVIGERPTNGSGTFSPTGGWTNQPNFYNGVGTYWTQDHTMIRKKTVKQGVTSMGTPFNVPGDFNPSTQWDSLPQNFFDSLGTHTCDCGGTVNAIGNEKNATADVSVYPNPSDGSTLHVKSGVSFSSVELLDLTGHRVCYSQNDPNTKETILNPGFPVSSGLYFLKVGSSKENFPVKKILIR